MSDDPMSRFLGFKPRIPVNPAAQARWDAQERDAEYTFMALRVQIETLQESAAAEGNEVGWLVPFANDVVHVREVGWEGRNVISVAGTMRDQKVRLVLHHSQLQMLLVPVKPETGKPARVLYLVPERDEAGDADEPENAR